MNAKTLTLVIWIVAAVAIGATAYNLYQNYPIGGESEPYVVDLLKVQAAQRLKVSSILGQSTSTSDYYEAFNASGSIMAAAKAVAKGSPVVVEQAYLIHNFTDITDEVLEQMGLPNPGKDFSLKASGVVPSSEPEPSAKIPPAVSNPTNVDLPY
jgi:hypothetical protein